MSETAPATPAAPVTPSAPADAAAAPKPHHSATQPREVGKFAGPPGQAEPKAATPPPAPRMLKALGREIPEEEALAMLEDKAETQRLSRAEVEELQRLRSESQRWADPRQVLTAEQRQQIALEAFQEWKQQQEERALPPEQQQLLQERRRLQRERAELAQQREAEQAKRTEALNAALHQQATGNVRATLQILGAEERPGLVFREVARAWAESAAAGRKDTPRVIAMKVQQRLDALAEERAVARGPKALFGNEKMVAALNALKPEDVAEHFERLKPFIDMLRALNLEKRGLTAVPGGQQAVPQPHASQVQAAPPPEGRMPRTDREWIGWFQAGNKPTEPAHYQALQRLKARDLL